MTTSDRIASIKAQIASIRECLPYADSAQDRAADQDRIRRLQEHIGSRGSLVESDARSREAHQPRMGRSAGGHVQAVGYQVVLHVMKKHKRRRLWHWHSNTK